ncbi:hypothetical protein CH063_06309 [Colletotrichum higginsianum]|uniref:Uncharacterized protein n=1 Tax=Colletotrichum higginsianum (strain IMI 349063) TaxID=759273 RepID=H1V231_COLHI|nr:hypothetical protein CH063_06309 [Colletotrichum higginsianum]
MPNRDSGYSSGAPIPAPDSSRSAVLGDIQKAGGYQGLEEGRQNPDSRQKRCDDDERSDNDDW